MIQAAQKNLGSVASVVVKLGSQDASGGLAQLSSLNVDGGDI